MRRAICTCEMRRSALSTRKRFGMTFTTPETIFGSSEFVNNISSELYNSNVPKELAGYSSARMARKRGDLEEKLRAEVRRFVRPDGVRAEQGRNQAIAKTIKKPASWVTEYINGRNHANLDVSVALMSALGVELSDLLGRTQRPDPLPRHPELDAYEALNAAGRRLALGHMQMLRDSFPRVPQPGSDEQTTRMPEGKERKERGRR